MSRSASRNRALAGTRYLVTDLTVTESNIQLVGFEDDAAEGAFVISAIRYAGYNCAIRLSFRYPDRPMSSHRLSIQKINDFEDRKIQMSLTLRRLQPVRQGCPRPCTLVCMDEHLGATLRPRFIEPLRGWCRHIDAGGFKRARYLKPTPPSDHTPFGGVAHCGGRSEHRLRLF